MEGAHKQMMHRVDTHNDVITQYKIAVHPSIVIHWNTVNMAKPMLSKEVMPKFGPSHFSRHVDILALHT
jgi:hypothetical protein